MEIKIKPSFLTDPVIRKLFSLFKDSKAELYVVGGAVRDALKGYPVGDLDFATNLSPKQMLSLFVKHHIRAIPTGGSHGTVTAVMHGRSFEITPYRSDIKTDGRHAEVHFVPSLKEDALRRDFTINALYLDSVGQVYDFVGGVQDLKKNVVRFIGDPDQRIQEDYLRILRFFRFSGLFSDDLNPAGFSACIQHREGLSVLSRERVLDEMLKLMSVPRLVFILESMFEFGILSSVFPTHSFSTRSLERLIDLDTAKDSLRRLFCVVPRVASYLPLSNIQKKRLKILSMLLDTPSVSLYEILYYHGKQAAEDFFLLGRAKDYPLLFDLKDIEEVFAFLPPFPVRGEDLMRLGFKGPAVGKEIKRLEKKWLAAQCRLNKKELLDES